jgi:triacylglycerol esterase/lipase EstA (alpha/beta hydrolase family)
VRRGRTITTVAACALAALPPAAPARDYAPVDRPGPPLSVPDAALAKNVVCKPGVSSRAREPILLVPGTTLRPSENFSWNYERAFGALGLPYCTVELPDSAMGDVQVAGEYVVYAIRRAHALSGRKVQILGYSQGGMVPRWALRFWPDTRALVDDLIGLDPSNHGTLSAEYCRTTRSCPIAHWEQMASAAFIAALNSRQETFAGISYTAIYSRTDEVVTPNLDDSGSSSLRGEEGDVNNVAIQDICPADASEHLAMGSYDAVGYALALDALTHDGPASTARIPLTVCAQPFQPGVNPATFPADWGAYLAAIGNAESSAKQVSAEPPLKCYVFADCPIAAAQPKSGTLGERRKSTRRRAKPKRRKQARHDRKRKRATRRAQPRFTG